MTALIFWFWSALAVLTAAVLAYPAYLRDDDPWWLPIAAPWLITWCAVWNWRHRARLAGAHA